MLKICARFVQAFIHNFSIASTKMILMRYVEAIDGNHLIDAFKKALNVKKVNVINGDGIYQTTNKKKDDFSDDEKKVLEKQQRKAHETVMQQFQNTGALNIICRACHSNGPEGGARAFLASDGSITLCSNRLYSKKQVANTLVHELTHAYDVSVLIVEIRF